MAAASAEFTGIGVRALLSEHVPQLQGTDLDASATFTGSK
jgi:hypothetical protein